MKLDWSTVPKVLVRRWHVQVTLSEIEDNDLYVIIGRAHPRLRFLHANKVPEFDNCYMSSTNPTSGLWSKESPA